MAILKNLLMTGVAGSLNKQVVSRPVGEKQS
jgi:hypothetical protein